MFTASPILFKFSVSIDIWLRNSFEANMSLMIMYLFYLGCLMMKKKGVFVIRQT